MTIKINESKKEASDGSLHLYKTGDYLRPASAAELTQSLEAAKTDGGRGVFIVHGWSVYVQH